MPYKNLLIEKSQGIALITINRPEKRNALDPQTWREVGAVVEELEADADVRVIIFTGAGEKCFAAGSDIAQIKERSLIDGLAAPLAARPHAPRGNRKTHHRRGQRLRPRRRL